jgi:hypothetical protein
MTTEEIANRIKAHVSPTKGITNDVLEKFCKKLCSSDFKGVYSADYLPAKLAGRARFILIVNLGLRRGIRKNLPVGHFVTIVAKPASVYYIDSFGLPSTVPHVNRFLTLCKRKIHFNLRQLQDFNSMNCGFYAMLFSYFMDRQNWGKKTFALKFNEKKLKENDKLCMRYLNKLVYSVQ